MTSNGTTLYDEVSYPGHPYHPTHPDHLATIGTLYGMTPAPPARCRVLELGCGIGGNLLPMAARYPDSEFVGVDLSQREIEKGQSHIAAYGLRNATLHHGDIAEVTDAWGSFDYIVSHGVYSWVPPHVREAMLAIIGRSLNPQGISYVSYNAHPGSHLRDLCRDIMNFHVHDIKDPLQRIGQARAILKFVVEGSDSNSVYGGLLRDQMSRVSGMGDSVLFHDDLNEGSTAFLLHTFVAAARSHGLQYLSDSTLSRRDLSTFDDPVKEVLQQFPDKEFLARDQIQDFILGHGFRRTLLCRGDVALQRSLPPEMLAGFHLECSARPDDPAMDPNAPEEANFKLQGGEAMATNHRLTKAALRELGRRWPCAVAFDDLIARALAELDPAVRAEGGGEAANIKLTRNALFTAALRGHITLHVEPSAFVTTVSERPEASFVGREQARLRLVVTNQRHVGVHLGDEHVRQLLMLLDGTRNLDQLVADLKGAMANLPAVPDADPIDRASVAKALTLLVELSMLVR